MVLCIVILIIVLEHGCLQRSEWISYIIVRCEIVNANTPLRVLDRFFDILAFASDYVQKHLGRRKICCRIKEISKSSVQMIDIGNSSEREIYVVPSFWRALLRSKIAAGFATKGAVTSNISIKSRQSMRLEKKKEINQESRPKL